VEARIREVGQPDPDRVDIMVPEDHRDLVAQALEVDLRPGPEPVGVERVEQGPRQDHPHHQGVLRRDVEEVTHDASTDVAGPRRVEVHADDALEERPVVLGPRHPLREPLERGLIQRADDLPGVDEPRMRS
jgi:hypothetical protein